jgi:hypothetical protein
LDILAISIDDITQPEKQKYLYEKANSLGIILRGTINLWRQTFHMPPILWIRILKELGFRQVSFRQLSIPEKIIDTPEAKSAKEWIEKNAIKDVDWYNELDKIITKSRKIRTLNFGASVYSYEGMAITYFPYCVQENNNGEDIRSLIFQEDGHLYDSWNDPASIIF